MNRMTPSLATTRSGGRLTAVAVVAAFVLVVTSIAQAAPEPSPNVTVNEERGVYHVMARFVVDGSPSVVLAVLTDYEQIPRFMPDVRTSVIRERAAGRAVVEQEAVSEMLMFSKRVHLVLDIDEQVDALRFRDVCQASFAKYEGAWRLTPQDQGTEIVYELTAEPSFGVPGWVLKRLLRRDSAQMIERLQREVESRARLQ